MEEVGRSASSGIEPPTASATTPSVPAAGEPRTRGFLFCDLRGYTAFVEAHGDQDASVLLERYRSIVRGAVARATGAEVRTEGDSFYVVFPSASPAVRCGLDIVAAAAAATAETPERPIRVGVGVHAGESVEHAEGYVGSAVNIAARVCAQAEPGEVLVTETVRSLVRTSLAVSFTPRGHPRLKGIAEPIVLYRVTSGAAVVGRTSLRPRPTSALAGLAVLGAALVVAGAAVVARPWEPATGGSPSPGTTVPPSAVSPAPSGVPSASASASAGVAPETLPGRLAYIASQVIGVDPNPRWQLFVADAAGGEPKRMTELTDRVMLAAWSPDGRELVYTLQGAEDVPPRVVAVESAPSWTQRPWPWATDIIVWEGRQYLLNSIDWSPADELIVDGGDDNDISRIFAISADGTTVRLVTEPDPELQPANAGDSLPAVSPDGSTIAFVSGSSSRTRSVWAAGSDGTGRIQVTAHIIPRVVGATNAGAAGPSWSPSGASLVFAGQQEKDGRVDIWTIDAQGTNLRQLTDDDLTDERPAWSPDGRWIAWTRTVAGQRQIWVMAPDGRGARPLVVGAKGEQLDLVGWAPDPG